MNKHWIVIICVLFLGTLTACERSAVNSEQGTSALGNRTAVASSVSDVYKKTSTATTSQVPFTVENGKFEIRSDVERIPSGDYLLYYDWRDDELRLLPESEVVEDIALIDHSGTISSDAKLFSSIIDDELYVADILGKHINSFQLDIRCFGSPSLSPTGEWVSVECEDGIRVFSAMDGSSTLLTDWGQPSVDSFHSPIWAPNGDYIAYSYRQLSSLQPTQDDGIYLVDPDCLDYEASCEDVVQGIFFPYSNDPIKAVSPDSLSMAIYDETGSIRTVNIENDESQLVIENLEYIDGLSWTADGEWLAYSTEGKIYKIPVEGGEPVLIVEGKGYLVSWIRIEPDS